VGIRVDSAVSSGPRIAPGGREEIGQLNQAIVAVLGRGGPPPNVFTTLARHRRLFRPWLWFAATLMPGGSLPRRDTELVILRVAHLSGSEYEWEHHARIGRTAGLSAEEIERVRSGVAVDGWTPRQALLLRAVDELHERRDMSEDVWNGLRPQLSDTQLIELCMLTGHYEMVAMTLNTLRVQPDVFGAATGSHVGRWLFGRDGGRSR
jgi:alkylhydroperoxidase family enzyme